MTLTPSPDAGSSFTGWTGAEECTVVGPCQLTMNAAKNIVGYFRDDVAPSIPQNVTLGNPTENSLTLTWSASSDNIAVTGYFVDVALDSGFTNYVSGYTNRSVGLSLSLMITGLTPQTTYYARVRADDNAGNLTPPSDTAHETTQGPVVALTTYVTSVTYEPSGQLKRVVYGNGAETTYTYDPETLRLTRILTVNAQGVTLQDLGYIYDALGNILNITDAVNSASQTFQYDHLNRLVFANNSRYGAQIFGYDALGNLWEKDNKIYQYGGTAGPHAVTSIDGSAIGYDPNGNMTSRTKNGSAIVYQYDNQNRLTDVLRDGQPRGVYGYDDSGNRIKKQSLGVTSHYVGSMYEKNGSEETRYIFAGGTRVAALTNNTLRFYHADHLGGANVTTDDQGQQLELTEYKPYGEFARRDQLTLPQNKARHYYTDQYLDEEEDLYYYGARYYDPGIGRFITPDWIVQAPGYSQSLNRYSYTWNNPVNNTDPSGNFTVGGFFNNIVNNVKGAVHAFKNDPLGTILSPITGLGRFVGNTAYDLINRPKEYLSDVKSNVVAGVQQIVEKVQTSDGQDELAADGVLFGASVALLHKAGHISSAKIGYHATTQEATQSILKEGFKESIKPGRLGSGIYVNNTIEGAIAEFNFHNPGAAASVIKVRYDLGVNAAAMTVPQRYVSQLPLNVSTITAESVRLRGTFNTNILNSSAVPLETVR